MTTIFYDSQVSASVSKRHSLEITFLRVAFGDAADASNKERKAGALDVQSEPDKWTCTRWQTADAESYWTPNYGASWCGFGSI
jgi:hypothetical protein